VERQFTPVDAIAEVMDNLTNALLQATPKIVLNPVEPASEDNPEAMKAQQKEIAELSSLLGRWADRRRLWAKARAAVRRSRWATWGALRVWIPESAVSKAIPAGGPNETGIADPIIQKVPIANLPDALPDHEEQETTQPLPTGLKLDEGLDYIALSAPPPDQAFVYVDPDTQQEVGIFLYADQRTEFVELCWIDQDTDETVFRVLTQGGDMDEVRHDLAGRLPLAQMEGELLITEPVRMQQAQLNFANSIMTRVMETAGFPERVIVDGMPEGEWTDVEPTAPVLEIQIDKTGKTWYLVPTAGPTLGAGVVREVKSKADDGPNNLTVPRTAQVIKFEPTDPVYIIRAKSDARLTILKQCKQGHIEMDGDATSSGFSRQQARTTHLADVTNMQEPLERMLQQVFEAALRLTALMSPQAVELLARYTIAIAVTIDLGPIDALTRTAILDSLKAGALSLPTALTLLQVDDVSAEIERIRSQPESQQAAMKAKADIGGVFCAQWGLDAVTAAKMVGLTPEQVKLIEDAQAQEPPPDPNALAGAVPPRLAAAGGNGGNGGNPR
jgi:hypothetical protein